MRLAIRSLFRRCLRVASFCAEDQRTWMVSYVRIRFRDDAIQRGSPTKRAQHLCEAEDELQRMVSTLLHAGRLEASDTSRLMAIFQPVAERLSPSGAPASSSSSLTLASAGISGGSSGASSSSTHAPSAPALSPYEWDENAVGAWLQGLGLGRHAPTFARCRVDGRLLLRLDEDDLAEDLQVGSRLERKKVLVELERLREGLADALS